MCYIKIDLPFTKHLLHLVCGIPNIHIYYMNTNEIPGELSREKHDIFTCENNMLSSDVKRSRLLWLHDTSRLSQQKKMLK